MIIGGLLEGWSEGSGPAVSLIETTESEDLEESDNGRNGERVSIQNLAFPEESQMKRVSHIRNWEGLRVRFYRATQWRNCMANGTQETEPCGPIIDSRAVARRCYSWRRFPFTSTVPPQSGHSVGQERQTAFLILHNRCRTPFVTFAI